MKTFSSYIVRLYSDVWNYGFLVPDEIAKLYASEKAKRVLCTVNGKVTWHAGIMPHGNGEWFVNINKAIRNELKVDEGDKIDVQMEADTSKYGMAICEEMQELLHQDEDGSRLFHQLTPGKQRSLLYIINKPKSADIRLSKAITTLEFLKSWNGELDFKKYNEALKNRIK